MVAMSLGRESVVVRFDVVDLHYEICGSLYHTSYLAS